MREKELMRASQALALRSLREHYHMSRSDIIRHGKIARQTVYAWENGLRRVPSYIFKLYELLGEKYGLVFRAGDQAGTDTTTSE